MSVISIAEQCPTRTGTFYAVSVDGDEAKPIAPAPWIFFNYPENI